MILTRIFQAHVSEALMIGTVVSHYRIVEKLGEGGMGVVYLTEDIRLKRRVALKFLAPHLSADETSRKRFLREARAAAALDHPNICTVYEIDAWEGRTFIAMALVEGETLASRIRKGPLDVEEALAIANAVADGLAAAHKAGIVHRDIKPANILYSDSGRVTILDFGLAHLGSANPITRTGETYGTASYMSPEQLQGETGDARSDLWSLGIVLYEMLAGRPPFSGAYDQAIGYAIVNQDPQPASSIRSEVPEIVDRLLERALEKDPDDRYQTADDLRSDLLTVRDWRNHVIPSERESLPRVFREESGTKDRSTPNAIGVTTPYSSPLRRPVIRRTAYSAGFLLLLYLAFVLWPWGSRDEAQDEAAASIAVLPLANLSGNPDEDYFSDGMTDAVITDLARIGALRVTSRTSVMRYRDTEEPLPSIARELNVDHIVEGSVTRAGDRVRITVQLIRASDDSHMWAQDFERELTDVLALQGEVARAIADQVRVRLSPEEESRLSNRSRINPDAYEDYLRGYHLTLKWNVDDIARGREYFLSAIEKDSSFAKAYAGLADTYISMSYYPLVRPTDGIGHAEAALHRAILLDSTVALPRYLLGFVRGMLQHRWAEAEAEYIAAAELDPGNSWGPYHYAMYYLVPTGQLDLALEHVRNSTRAEPLSANIRTSLGKVYLWRREYENAIQQFDAVLELDPQFGTATLNRAIALTLSGRVDEVLPETGPPLRAWMLAWAGRHEEARSVLANFDADRGPGYRQMITHAQIYAALGDVDRAFDALAQCYKDRSPGLVDLTVDPRYDALRLDPRYHEFVARLGLGRQ